MGRAVLGVCLLLGWVCTATAGQTAAPAFEMSPRGTAATQVRGTWVGQTPGDPVYQGGKWIVVDYGRPILRGRSNPLDRLAARGNASGSSERIWRLGANETTRLRTDVPLVVAGRNVEPGEYSLFVAIRNGAWTLIISRQPFQVRFDAANTSDTWGAQNYSPAFDVVRAPVKLSKQALSVEQLTIGFANVTARHGELVIWWATTLARVEFDVR
jgi:hypothetical protein